jgi:hypothetical protein
MREVMVLPAVELHHTRPTPWQKNLTECEDFYCLSFLDGKNPSTLCVLLPVLPRMRNLQRCVCCYQSFLECKTFNLVCVCCHQSFQGCKTFKLCVCVCVCVFHSRSQSKKLCSKKDRCEWEKTWQLPADIQWHFVGLLQSNKAKMLVCEFATNSLFSIFLDQLVINTQSEFAISPRSKAMACKWA